ncbi:MAG: PHP domain-containing protein [Patescibacteria group bacterium]|nr:PHP domain-containing protein [Patescibacteria group bacterium]
MRYIDLHLHSYYSDGLDSPKDLVKKAKKEKFSIISLTDHNCLDGVEEAIKAGRKYKIKIIPGVEIETKFRNYSFHLLGYRIDWRNQELRNVLKKMQDQRKERIEECLLTLTEQGFAISKERIYQGPSKYIGLNWIIDFLKRGKNWQKVKRDFRWKKNQILTLPEIIQKYFVHDKKQILPAVEISFEKAISLIKKAGGIPVLAHPAEQLSWRDDWLFSTLKKKGLEGVEAISAHHNWANIEHYQKIAKELDLLITIGSDYHGDLPTEWQFPIKSLWQYFKVKIDPYFYSSLKKIIT